MNVIISFFLAHIGAIVGGLVGAGGLIFGAFRHQQANAATAAASEKVAQAQQQVAAVGQQVAQEDAQAARAASQAVVNARAAEEQAAAIPADQLDAEGAALGILRKD